ncbi:endonuclease NucS [Hyperthermus butylicus]|uniref:Endonuclease NucS n=1 Tax=Hyperthermus butylicus (strain DSM 5456 / JCM 9403 / PLM1-5) TaxID=415426 RepID=A2BLT3_HYPBU|nr:endonuclease NucS [Hyperthermus butylicus]ABM80944.1 conserved archaeal protein [Hyperthermus butylicus DSM 5456]
MKPRIVYVASPSLSEARSILHEALKRHDVIVMLARCRVYYEGRGASKLGDGDRLIVVKPDGAVLVHRPTGYSPVNWQPESQVLSVEERDGVLLFRSVRKRPREVLEIHIEEVYALLAVHGLVDEADFIEYLDEKEIADYLAKHPELVEEGLRVLRRERPIETGYADIVAVDKDGNYVVIEVKRVNAGLEAVKQLQSYVEAFKQLNPGAKIRGILVAPSISKEALALLQSLGLEYRRIDVQKLFRDIRRQKGQPLQSRSLLDFLGGGRAKS